MRLLLFLLCFNNALAGVFFPLNSLEKDKVIQNTEVKKVGQNIPVFRLNAVVNGKEHLAIINGNICKVGDKLEDGCVLTNIGDQSATIRCNKVKLKLHINLLGEIK